MNGMEVSKELKCDIESNQTQLKTAICNHQNILARLKADPDDVSLQKSLNKAEAEIIVIGLEQKNLLERLREEYKAYQKSVNTNLIKNGLEERRFNLTNALNRARKQTIGLSIERVSPTGSLSPDNKTCVTCKQSGALTLCEVCGNSFHISCHNRPLTHTPRQCPKCIVKETRTVGSLNVPSYMTVSCFTPAQMSEKLDQKKQLEEIKQSLAAELTQLQDRHSQLTISLKDQKNQQDQLLMTQHSTQDKIKQILSFIEKVKNPLCSEIETIEIS
ncbi:unnamed protein product [Diabrotica balteata]|uniref:Zinc finger PHD-type domain-containing protein n=1 Tax=Diabrotica balteata TaxID=107213 RepID=A0A9N9SLL8_DIABA|nr:unnamed protein product [Diabrotica balteata]